MSQQPKDLRTAFLNHVLNSREMVTVFLTNGVKLSGVITWFDDECVTLTRDGVTQLVFRHAMSTVMPQQEFQIYEVLGVEPGNIGNI